MSTYFTWVFCLCLISFFSLKSCPFFSVNFPVRGFLTLMCSSLSPSISHTHTYTYISKTDKITVMDCDVLPSWYIHHYILAAFCLQVSSPGHRDKGSVPLPVGGGGLSAWVSKGSWTPAWVLKDHTDRAVCGYECVVAWRETRRLYVSYITFEHRRITHGPAGTILWCVYSS